MADDRAYDIPVYAPAARKFHWWVALLILLQFPIAFYMIYRSEEMMGVNDKGEPVKGVWDGVTNTLFSSHKTIGLLIFLVVLFRLGYRLANGAPRSDPSVPPALTGISHLLHWSIYALLILIPIGGYIGISYGQYLDVFGVTLPAVTAKDEKFAEVVFGYHGLAATILLGLVAVHIGAAIYHKFVRKDRVVERMLPKKNRLA
jgi:cytochrome b561